MRNARIKNITCSVVASVLVGTLSWSSQVVPMSFEEAVRSATVVALVRVTESDEVGTLQTRPSGSTFVVQKHHVHVDDYLKGLGSSDIIVETLGGKFIKDVDGKPTEFVSIAGGQPQIPGGQSRLLLFLVAHGGADTFMICSATHGVVPVQRDSTGAEIVALSFEDPEVMPPPVFEAFSHTNPKLPHELFPASVKLKDLRTLVERAAARKTTPRSQQARPSP